MYVRVGVLGMATYQQALENEFISRVCHENASQEDAAFHPDVGLSLCALKWRKRDVVNETTLSVRAFGQTIRKTIKDAYRTLQQTDVLFVILSEDADDKCLSFLQKMKKHEKDLAKRLCVVAVAPEHMPRKEATFRANLFRDTWFSDTKAAVVHMRDIKQAYREIKHLIAKCACRKTLGAADSSPSASPIRTARSLSPPANSDKQQHPRHHALLKSIHLQA